MPTLDGITAPTQHDNVTFPDTIALPLEPWFSPEHDAPRISRLRKFEDFVRQFHEFAYVDPRRSYLFAKRCGDIVGSLLAIVIMSPLMLLLAAVIKLTDQGPVFYVHNRVGLRGREFACIKFRSMVVNADSLKDTLQDWNSHDDSRTFKIPDDPRVTWIGRLMRRSSLDEVPQLFNVLLGHMSLVGPRPPVPSEVAQYTRNDMKRLVVKPGLTCLWQVSGRSRLPFPEQLRLDLEYIENQSLWLDCKLLFRTVPAVLSADGAY
jgi:lipopolysaccharide/colanic/teichoic acid biosynthesis glycosyltransferase